MHTFQIHYYKNVYFKTLSGGNQLEPEQNPFLTNLFEFIDLHTTPWWIPTWSLLKHYGQ